MNIKDVIQELVDERGLNETTLVQIALEGILAAYQKKYPDLPLRVEIVDDKFVVAIEKKVVSRVEDPDREVSMQKVRNIAEKAAVGDMAWVPFEGKIGRVEILKARQVIAQKIRQIEAEQIYKEFKEKEGEIVLGTVHKHEFGGVVIMIGETLALLPKRGMIPGEQLAVGYTIRALLKEVLMEPQQDYQLILDRASTAFLRSLFELEIPEVFDRLVEIKEIVRIPGYRAKVVVTSRDRNVDPVGTCIGVGGSRIKPILKELNGEKIDVIGWSESPEIFLKNALKPALIDSVELSADGKRAVVSLAEDQRALAIGKGGQNVALAMRLTGVEIQFAQKAAERESAALHDDIFHNLDDDLDKQ